jgi:CRISPR-associated protein Csa3
MGRLFVFTLGFTESFALRRFNALSAGHGDGFICLTARPVVSGVVNAYQTLVAYAGRLGVSPLGLFDIDMSDAPSAVYSIIDVVVRALRSSGFDVVVFDVSGGMRLLVASATLSAIMLSRFVSVIFYVGGEGGEYVEFKLDSRDFNVVSLPQVSGEDLKILGLLVENEGLGVEGIAGRLGLSGKTVANRLAFLQRMGLVYRRGRGGGVYLTSWGKLTRLMEELRALKGTTSGTSSTYT